MLPAPILRLPFTSVSALGPGTRRALATAACIGLGVAPAAAQWNALSLHPPGSPGSECYGIRSAQQVGRSNGDAIIWSGAPGSTVNLGPGILVETDTVEQVGVRNGRAALWSGTAGSYVDLHPTFPNVSASVASGVHAGLQSGYYHEAINYNFVHAGMWTGTEASWVDLSPPGSLASFAEGVHNAQQVGSAFVTPANQWHAGVWYNSAASFVDMHPAAAAESFGVAAFSGKQAGYVTLIGESFRRASLWSSTAASWVDLHPPLASESYANAIYGAVQAGYATIGGVNHASFWAGSASTWIDLHAFLPPNFSESAAYGVWTNNFGVSHVVGNAYNATAARYEAILWVQSSPTVTPYCFGDGQVAPCPCVNYAPLYSGTGCLNSLGIGGKLVSTGTASISGDTFTLLGSQMPNGSALFYQGTTQLLGQIFGDGLRCVSGSILRLGPTMNVNGSSSYPSGLAWPVSVQGQVTSPGMRAYQIWYRNAADYCTPAVFNLTNGLAVTWAP